MFRKGLTEKEVLELRKKYGENILPEKEKPSWFSILFSQFKSPLIYTLLLVAFISLVLKEYIDANLVGLVIILNVLMGFFQEYNAQKTLVALKKILKPQAIVIRDGERKVIEIRELEPGDIVLLNSGDRIPADGKLIEGVNLIVSEAILTGEEEAVGKAPEAGKDLLFMGTTVLSGRGIMEVTKIGKETEIGKIGESLAKLEEVKTPLQLKFEEFTKILARIVLVICLIIFLVGVIHQENIWKMLRFSIVLSVAAIPEGLPIALTIILALGMRRILKRKGLVKKLLSIETLGATSVICVDKTGTLTEGVMRVVKTDFVNNQKALLALILANPQRTALEIALWDYVKKESWLDSQKILELSQTIYEEPFDSEKKYSLTVTRFENKETAFIIGAPEIILKFCNPFASAKNDILAKIEKWAEKGLRVVGLAFKEKENLKEKKDFSWLGLVGIEDPVREGVREAIAKAQEAGIKVKIVTGDFRKTAERVAKRIGLKVGPDNVMEGQELEMISEEELKKRINSILLFTRISPHQKLKIIKVLKEKKEVVAMTGDGVNDAPALKKADIGVVVGNASDVAKEAGDLILLDSNFKTILAAVEEGRLIFSNIKKVVGYTLSDSFAEIILIFGSVLLNLPYPLTILQILWIHLICDGPPDIVLGFEPMEKDLMKERPENLRKERILSHSMRFLIFSISLMIGLLCLFFFKFVLGRTGDLTLARTLTFTAFAAGDLIYLFAFRNLKEPIFKTENFFQNKYLFLAVVFGFLLTFIAIYLPVLNRVLETVPLKSYMWLWVFVVAFLTTFLVEIIKFIDRRRGSPQYT